MMPYYDLEYHKQNNRSHILPNILNGAKQGVLSQFIADIVLSILLYNETIVIEDIEISEIPAYYAAVISGMTVAFLMIYMDSFAVALFSTLTYAFIFELLDSQIHQTEFYLRPAEIIFDTGVSLILIYCFDPVAHNQYQRYREKRHFIEPIHQRMDRNMAQNIFIIVLVNTYGFLKLQEEKQKGETSPTT